jgi:hypothetical protein
MAITAISDIINPEVLKDQISAKFPDMLVLGNSNLVEVNSTIPLGAPGTKFKLPFWKRINGFGALTEGTAMTPAKVTAAAEYAVVQRAGAAYEVYDTAQLVSIPDPVTEIASQIGRRAAEYIDAALVTEAEKTPNTFDQTGSLKTNSNGTMDQNAIVVAMTRTLGDNYMKMLQGGAIIMHSKVYGDLLQLGAIQNQYQFGGDVLKSGVIPTLMGLPIFVSDRVTVNVVSTVNKYQTYIVGPGALALFYQRQVQVEYDRDVLLQADIIASTVHFSPHLFGWDDDSDAQAAEDVKSIHVVNVKSN